MQISDYSFYRLYQAAEDNLTRELEYRRVAEERFQEEADRAPRMEREPVRQRVMDRIRALRRSLLGADRA